MSKSLSNFSFFDTREKGIFLNKKYFKCEILIPKSYLLDNMAVRDGQKIESIGVVIVRLFDSEKKSEFYQLTIPLNIVFNTDEEPVEKIFEFNGEQIAYTVLTVYSNGCVSPNSTYIQSLQNAITFMQKFNSAKFANTIPYAEIVSIFKDGINKNGIGLGVPNVLIEMVVSELCRDADNDFEPFRFKINKTRQDTGYKFIGIKKIPQKTSVLAALAFEDMHSALRSSIIQTRSNFEQRMAPIEKLIFY